MRKIIRFSILTIGLSLVVFSLQAQTTAVTGTVTDKASGEPMIGVSVAEQGTTNGTITDLNGEFKLNVSSAKSAVLNVSYVGYKSIQVLLKGKERIAVSLQEDANLMEEVVVVGYGRQKKESVVGSIASIDNATLVALPVSNVTQALAGKLAGVQVVQPSGEVGRDEASVYVRGLPTYGTATPLIIVDGVTREGFAQIDPNEIQSINVLKDASATAVYGVKGANGVIIVTTRRGAVGKPKVSVSAQHAITEPMRIPNPLPAYETAVLINLKRYVQGKNDDYSALDLIKYRTGSSPYLHPDTHWVDEVMKDYSSMQQYNINVSGGTPFVRYFVSGGFLTQDGFYRHDPYTNFSRYNLRSNLDFDITKKLQVSFSLGARIEKRQFPGASKDNSWNIYRGAFATGGRHNPVYNPDGSLAGPATSAFNLLGLVNQQGIYRDLKSVIEMGITARYKLDSVLKGLSLRGQLAFDNAGGNGVYYKRNYATYYYNVARDAATDSDREAYLQQGENSHLSYQWGSSSFDQKTYGEIGFEYTRSFGIHNVTGLLLANRNLRLIGHFNGYADQGIVVRATYDYNKRYFAEVNAGYNGSENFARGKRYALFPSFALGWLASNEDFISESSVARILTHLKLRGSLGWVGNDKSGDITRSEYQADRFIYIQQYYDGGGAYFGSGDTPFRGIYQGNIANADVTWETGRKLNVGLESGFFNGLLGVNVDVFYERRTDILTNIASVTPDYVGKAFMPANVGIVENRGMEMEFSHDHKIGQDFSYGIKGNYSFVKNKVVRKSDPAGLLPYQREEGYSIGVPLMYQYIGVFESFEDIADSPSQMGLDGNTEVRPGDTKYLDLNGDGIIDRNDAFRQGYGTVPEITYGVTLSLRYKRVDLTALAQGAAHAQFRKNWEIMWPFSNADNAYYNHWRYWTPETNGEQKHIRFYGNYLNNEPSGGANSFTMGSGDYVRLKNLEVGYTFPKAWTSKLFMSSARVYFSANNLFLWAKEPFLDPDNRDQRGGNMPQTRAFNFGVNVNF